MLSACISTGFALANQPRVELIEARGESLPERRDSEAGRPADTEDERYQRCGQRLRRRRQAPEGMRRFFHLLAATECD